MARRSLARLRNIGIVAHINAGKTTLTERFLFRSGRQPFMGAVDDGTATMDFMPEEQERGISISAAVTSVDWKGFHINLVDTPGHVDFTAEVERSLRVLDGAIVVLDAVRGVESQTEIVWRQAQDCGVPAVMFINKMDRGSADFEASLIDATDRLQCPAVPVVLPIREDGQLVGLCDVVEGRVLGAGTFDPEVWRPSRQAVVEACADFDDSILDDFVEGREVESARLQQALRRATLAGAVVPVLAGSALLNRGVDWLLTAACRYLPSPLDRPVQAVDGTVVVPDEDAPLCGLVFKVHFEEDQCLDFIRLYAGHLRAGDMVRASRHEEPVRIDAIYRVHAAEHEEVAEIGPGDIAALSTNQPLTTGETLFAPGAPIALEPLHFPPPVLAARLEVSRTEDCAAMEAAAERLSSEDPTLHLDRDEATGTLLVEGMGELHLQVFEERLRHLLRKPVRLSAPQVLLQDTVASAAAVTAECVRHLDGREYFAHLAVEVEPLATAGRAEVGEMHGVVPPDERRLRDAFEQQFAAGLTGSRPACNLRLTVREARGDLVDEAVCAEVVAIACRKVAAAAGVVTLEPYVDCVVSCPADRLSSALADLRSRGVDIQDVTTAEGRGWIRGELPLARVLGYATRLRSITKGLGVVSLRPIGMRPVLGEG